MKHFLTLCTFLVLGLVAAPSSAENDLTVKECDNSKADEENATKIKKYLFVNTTVIWHHALKDCGSRCMTLASITSREEQDRLSKEVSEYGVDVEPWIGGLYCATHDVLKWQNTLAHVRDGFTNFAPGEPVTDNKHNCLRLTEEHTWHMASCKNKRPYVCHYFE